jgi:hypothetical protein
MRIVVGGETRKCGKTTVVCRIVAGFPDVQWTAVKVSPHMHAGGDSGWSLTEDSNAGDTLRYRQAGASRTCLYCGSAEAGMGALLDILDAADDWIVETTSAAHLIGHDLALLVEAGDGVESKATAGRFPEHERVKAGEPELISLVAGRWKA